MAVLESVASGLGDEKSLRDIASESGLKLPTAARIAQTLVACGYLEQRAKKKGYILGAKLHSLSNSREGYRDFLDKAKPLMWAFSERTGEYVDLSALRNFKRVVLFYIMSRKSVQVLSKPEDLETPYRSLSGRLLLSGLSEELRLKAFQRNGPPGDEWPEASREAFYLKELSKIAEGRRLFRDFEEKSCIAVALKKNGVCVATLGVYLPSYRYKGELVKLIDKSLASLASSLEPALASCEAF